MIVKSIILLFLIVASSIAYDAYYEDEESIVAESYDTIEVDGMTQSVLRNTTSPPKNCTKPGVMCDTCSKVAFCWEEADGTLHKEDLYDCAAGTTCSAKTGECTDKPNPDCELSIKDYIFTCYQVGIYPDPFDCFKYHLCSPNADNTGPNKVSTPFRCKNGHSFDPLTTMCRTDTVNATCSPIISACKTPGEVGVVKRNPALYYTCLPIAGKFFPQILSCNADRVHNGTACVPKLPPAAVDANGNCPALGLFADPKICRNYLDCTAVARPPTVRACAVGMRFDGFTKKCVEFTCPPIV